MPIGIDGTNIGSVTIDGQEVQEITIDGNVAYQAEQFLLWGFSTSGQGDQFIEWSMDGWDITTRSSSTTRQAPVISDYPFQGGVTWDNNGSRLFAINYSDDFSATDDVQVWNTSNYDIDGANSSGAPPDVFAEEDLNWNPDGTVFYVISTNDGNIEQYNASTAFDITTLGTQQATTAGAIDSSRGFSFNTDGTKIYTAFDGQYRQFSLNTPFDLSSISSTPSATVNFVDGDYGLTVTPDGEKIIGVGLNGNIYQYNLTTPFDLSTMNNNPDDTIFTDVSGTTLNDTPWYP